MKKYIAIGSICVAMLFSACDNYLDVVPKGEAVLNSTDDYLGLIEAVNPSYLVEDGWYLSNEATWYKTEDLNSYTQPLRSAAFFWDESIDRVKYTETDMLYESCYNRIGKYNVVISNIDDSEGPAKDKALGMAQAKIMRAYNYFFLVNTFAKPYNKTTAAMDNGIIIHKTFDLEATSKQYSVAEVYEFIEQDIQAALANLPDRAKNSYRPTRSFGYALKAKVHLFKGELDLALTAALEALNTPYHKLWDMNEMYESTLAANPILGMMPSMWGMFAKHDDSDPENLLYQYSRTQNDPYPMYLRKCVMDLYDKTSDLRYITCMGYAMPPRPTTEVGAVQYGSMYVRWNPCGIRLSEVYLMIAECYARKDNPGKAMEYLNILREKRIMTKFYTELQTNDPAEALKWVREERKRELLLTCNSFFDMRRFCTQFNETLTKEYTTKDTQGNPVTKTYTLSPESHLLVFPFPQNATETSNLIQNSK